MSKVNDVFEDCLQFDAIDLDPVQVWALVHVRAFMLAQDLARYVDKWEVFELSVLYVCRAAPARSMVITMDVWETMFAICASALDCGFELDHDMHAAVRIVRKLADEMARV